MSIIINGITCEEIVADLTEDFDLHQGPRMRKGYLCSWADRFTVAQGLLGLSTTVSYGGVVTFLEPSSYPQLGTAWCFRVEIEPKGPPSQGEFLEFTNAIVWGHYRSQPWNFQGFDYQQLNPQAPYIYAKQNIKFSTETITIPGQYCWFTSAGKLIGQDYGFPVPVAEMEITLIRIPYLPAQEIITAQANPLNEYAFLGCDPGTLFFRGGVNHQTHDTAGNNTADLTLVFAYRPIPWDQAWNGTEWDTVVIGHGATAAFLGRSDLSTLIPSYYNA